MKIKKVSMTAFALLFALSSAKASCPDGEQKVIYGVVTATGALSAAVASGAIRDDANANERFWGVFENDLTERLAVNHAFQPKSPAIYDLTKDGGIKFGPQYNNIQKINRGASLVEIKVPAKEAIQDLEGAIRILTPYKDARTLRKIASLKSELAQMIEHAKTHPYILKQSISSQYSTMRLVEDAALGRGEGVRLSKITPLAVSENQLLRFRKMPFRYVFTAGGILAFGGAMLASAVVVHDGLRECNAPGVELKSLKDIK